MKKTAFIIFTLFLNISLFSQFAVDTSKTVHYILNYFLSTEGNIQIENVHYSGNKYSLGLFRNHCPIFPLSKGVIISSGDIWDAVGPNNRGNSGRYHYFKGDAELQKLANGKTFDAAIFEFDFVANSDSISFDYIFASEEYPEYVNNGLNDVFAFFISDPLSTQKSNIAICNNKPVTVDNINSGSNKDYFISNEKFVMQKSTCLSYSIQFDGLTVLLSTGFKLEPYKKYHFKICVSDVGDGYFDSAVFLRAHSFTSSGKIDVPAVGENIKSTVENEFVHFNADSASINFIPNISFDFDSYTIPDSSFSVLSDLISIFSKYFDYNIKITGYSDNIGSSDYNKNLSLNRAKAVSEYLVLHAIKKKRIKVVGLGNINPVANNETEMGRALNRRITIRMEK